MNVARLTAVASILLAGLAAAPAPAPPKTAAIVVFHTYGHASPFRSQFDVNLVKTFRERADLKVDLYIETVDSSRFGGPLQERLLRDYLREKYAGKKIAVVVTVFDSALAFALDSRDALFPGAPIAALMTRRPQVAQEHVSVIWSGNQFGDTVALALRLHPAARQVVVIDGAQPLSSTVVSDEASSQLAAIAERLPVTYFRRLALPDLLNRVQALPPDTIIVFGRQNIGQAGEYIADFDALPEIARVARAPIYLVSDQMVGLGAVGGVVISMEGQATQLARLAMRLAMDPSLEVPPAEGVHVPMFDWRQLRRWGLDERLLPPHSEIRFRQQSTWELYRWYIVAALTIIGVQTALLAALLINRTLRRRTEAALRTSESALRASDRQVQTLAGRLIAEQEVERSRLARDLHDDLSQQLSSLSMEIDAMASPDDGRDVVGRQKRAASARVATLATTVRDLSHALHPARLELLGLDAALDGLCSEMSLRAHVQIAFEHLPNDASIPPDVALCLFRVTQEALRNVVKHSGALTASVSLRRVDEILELRIVDSGRGFPTDVASNGLGLVSMRERVALIGGVLVVQSNAGRGTQIEVRVSLSAAHAQMRAS